VTATANAPLAAFRAGTRPCRIYEMGLSAVTAPTTNGQLGLKRSTAISVTPSGQVLGVSVDPNTGAPAALGGPVTGWGTAPTVAAAGTGELHGFAFNPAVGAAAIFTWPQGRELIVPANSAVNSELVLVNRVALAPGTWTVYFVWEE
jgi:hypothetical protein